MSVSTIDEQWRGFASNLGSWEGNVSQYDPDGNLKRRQASVLFIYVDSLDDKLKIETNKSPSILKIRLHRCGEQIDSNQLYLKGMDLAARGMVYEPRNGDMCSGGRNLSPLSGAYVEQLLNSRDEQGKIVARARLVTRFDAERLRAFGVFREQPSSLSYDVTQPKVATSAADSDLVATNAEANVEALCGTWRGSLTRLRAVGNEIECSSERYMARTRTSVEGNEIRMEGPLGGRGTVSENRKTVLFVDGARQWRLVFLGGGITAMTSLEVPNGGEEFFVELGWLVRKDFRMRTWRRYVGSNWVESCFVEEVRESG